MAMFTGLAEKTRDFAMGSMDPSSIVKYQATAADYSWFALAIGAYGAPAGVPCTFTLLSMCVTWFAMTRASGASLAQKLSHLKKVFTRPPCLCPWLTTLELALMKDLRVGLSKAFGGPGSKGPSEVICRELLDRVNASFRTIFHPTVATVMIALCDHLHDGIGRSDEVLHAKCFPTALAFYTDAILFNFTHAHPPKSHKTHGPPVAQVVSRGRPACSSLLALRGLHRTTACKHCYPKVSLGGVVDGAARLTYTTALRRFRQGLAHAFGGDKDAASQYGLHGLRAGGVCDALMRGVPTSAIKAQGHWALDSNVMEKHARFSTQQRMRFF